MRVTSSHLGFVNVTHWVGQHGLTLSVIAHTVIEWNPELPGILGFHYGVITLISLKVPKREIFDVLFFLLINPIWVCNSGTGIFFIFYHLRLMFSIWYFKVILRMR
jgi:hypothetical protein